jgi:hypothetical protein
MSEPTFTVVQKQDCFLIMKFLISAPAGFALNFSEIMIDPIISAGFNVLALAFMSPQPGHDVFAEFLRFVPSMPEIGARVWDHPMLHFISFFASWAVNRFTVVSFRQLNAFNEDERSLFQSSVDDITGRSEFVSGPTFPANSVELTQFGKPSEGELMKPYSFGSFRDTIASREVVSGLLPNLISLHKMKGGEVSVQIFFNNTLTFIDPYGINHGSQIPFVSESWLIASSLCLVTLFYLSCLSNEVIYAARPKLSVFI